MQKIIEPTAAPVNADEKVAENKVEFSRRFAVSKRTCDGWIARGMPHLKLSPRMVRVPVAEATQWVKENYFTQRRSKPEKV
jgi:hypothetical protein